MTTNEDIATLFAAARAETLTAALAGKLRCSAATVIAEALDALAIAAGWQVADDGLTITDPTGQAWDLTGEEVTRIA